VGTIGLDGLTGVAATLGAGLVIYLGWDRLHRMLERGFPLIDRVGMVAHYERLLKAIPALAAWSTRWLQDGHTSSYTRMAAGGMGLGLGAAVLLALPPVALPATDLPIGTAPALAAITLGAIAALVARTSLLLLLASGLVGFGSAALFLFVGAPDLAFTQFTVEVAFIVILVAVLLRTGASRQTTAGLRQTPRELVRAAIAVGGGGLATWMVLAGLSGPDNRVLADYFGANAVPEAQGRNVVNVILVDFRAIDTFGEIAVVAATFLAVLPLLLALKRKKETPR